MACRIFNAQNPGCTHPSEALQLSVQFLFFFFSSLKKTICLAKRSKYPCGESGKTVGNQEPSIACDTCDQCHHKKCINMSNNMFNVYTTDYTLEWTNIKCGIPPIHNLPSDSLLSPSSETSVDNTPKAKARMLRDGGESPRHIG